MGMQIMQSKSQLPLDFPDGTVVKSLPAGVEDTRDTGLIPGSGRSPGGGNGDPLKYSWPGKFPWTEEPGKLQSKESGTRPSG